mgnify:CR=1 FL=1
MNILSNTSGTFTFILSNDEQVTYTDWNDIPEDLDLKHVICFTPTIPPAPHTPEQHLEVEEWNGRLTVLLEVERNARSN